MFHLYDLALKVKLKAMKTHEGEVERLNEEGRALVGCSDNPEQVHSHLSLFNETWAVTYKKLGLYSTLLHYKCFIQKT